MRQHLDESGRGGPNVPEAPARIPRLLRTTAYGAVIVVFLGVYAPRVGRGFISDDFGWALQNRARSVEDVKAILTRDNGFYRPVVALSFAANEYFAGANPKPYGLTNLLLALACAVAIVLLGQSVGLPRAVAAVAAVIWLFNFHGINMAVLWLSGRTALLLTLMATSCVAALMRGHLGSATVLFALALFSKEEALLLPIVGASWIYIFVRPRPGWKRLLALWMLCASLVSAGYLFARAQTGAMTPATAPSYYRFTREPAALVNNILEYADRSTTFGVAVLLLAGVLLGRVPIRPSRKTWQVLKACACWVLCTFAVTVFLPVRSSLYVCLPSVATAIGAAVLMSELWKRAEERRQRLTLYAAVILPLLLSPVYAARTHRWVGIATFATRSLEELTSITGQLAEHSDVLLHDDSSARANLASAFGGGLGEAFYFRTNRRLNFWIQTESHEAATVVPTLCDGCADAEVRVENGRLVRVQ